MTQFDPDQLGADILRARERLFAQDHASAFTGLRHVAQKTTYDSLQPLASTPLGSGLRTHVAWLIRARLLHETNEAIRNEQRTQTLEVVSPTPVVISHIEARDKLLASRSEKEAEPWLEAFACATGYAEMRDRGERSVEVLGRLELGENAFALEPAFNARVFADTFLRSARDLVVHAGLLDLSKMLHALRGTEALSALPKNVSLRWLHDRFPRLATARIDPKSGPSLARSVLGKPLPVCGVSSAMRLLSRMGQTLEMCTEASVHDRITQCDPANGHAQAWGALFGALLTERDFARKGVGTSQTEEQLLLRTANRVAFAHMLLACYALTSEPEEAEAHLFRAPLRTPLRQYLRNRRLDASVDLWSMISAEQERMYLFDTLDSDWFRNPRAAEYFCAPRPLVNICNADTDATLLAARARAHFETRLA
jgi:hypothetical protein